MTTRIKRFLIIICASFTLLITVKVYSVAFHQVAPLFNGERAYQDIINQVSLGARVPGSVAHSQTISYIQNELEKAGWISQIQETAWEGFSLVNIIASRFKVSPEIIIGAHYDTRLFADKNTNQASNNTVPGANDGASGTSILLELARTLPLDSIPIDLVFFDAEDNGGLDHRNWIMGSRAFVSSISEKPRAVVIVDMVGDRDLNIYIERNSDPSLSAQIWSVASDLGYQEYFIPTTKHGLIDDHIPFLESGIPAVDIIDFDYPFWHTSDDTVDKVSAQSLEIVGRTLIEWVKSLK